VIDQPQSLHLSLPATLKTVVPGVLVLGVAGFVWGWWIAAVCLVVAALGTLGGDRRIELREGELRFVPLLPVRPVQSLPIAELGEFSAVDKRGALYSLVEAAATGPRRYRLFGVIPMRRLSFAAVYGTSWRARPMNADEIAALIESRREKS
jgi:hypothetical protein